MVFQKKALIIIFLLLGFNSYSQKELWINTVLTFSDFSFSKFHINGLGMGIGVNYDVYFTKSSSFFCGFDIKSIKYSLKNDFSDMISNSNVYLPFRYKYSIFLKSKKKVESFVGVNFFLQGNGEIGWNTETVEYKMIKYSGVYPLFSTGVAYDFTLTKNNKFILSKILLSSSIGFTQNGEIIINDKSSYLRQKIYGSFLELAFYFRLYSTS